MTIEAKNIFYRSKDAFINMNKEEQGKAIQHVKKELTNSMLFLDLYCDGMTPQMEAARVFLRIYDKN